MTTCSLKSLFKSEYFETLLNQKRVTNPVVLSHCYAFLNGFIHLKFTSKYESKLSTHETIGYKKSQIFNFYSA